MRVVLDTNVLISATQWPDSAARKVLRRLYSEGVKIFTSAEILAELAKVLIRDFDYDEEQVGALLSRLLAFVHIVKVSRNVKVVVEDPEDDKVINCALDCGADVILTYDRHLLKLNWYEKIKIVKPEVVWEEADE